MNIERPTSNVEWGKDEETEVGGFSRYSLLVAGYGSMPLT